MARSTSLSVLKGVIESRDGIKTSFIGSLNETREGWQERYEIVWEDRSPEGVAWVEDEFRYLWQPFPAKSKSS